MIFFLDNFDVNFLHRLCVNRFVSALIIAISSSSSSSICE